MAGVIGGKDGNVWLTEVDGDAIAHVPACGIGLRASYADTTLTLTFDVGTTSSATFTTDLMTNSGQKQVFSKTIPAIVPPQPSTLRLGPGFPYSGSVTVVSTLTDLNANLLCSESQSLVIGN